MSGTDTDRTITVCNCGKEYITYYNNENDFIKCKCNPNITDKNINRKSDEIICYCGRKFLHFASYKKHFLKKKCISEIESVPIINPINEDLTQSNSEIQITQDTNDNSTRQVATCQYCGKTITRNNVARHKNLHCKEKYKSSLEYQRLLLFGIQYIPDSDVAVKELYYRLSYENKLVLPQRILDNINNAERPILNDTSTTQDTVDTGLLSQSLGNDVLPILRPQGVGLEFTVNGTNYQSSQTSNQIINTIIPEREAQFTIQTFSYLYIIEKYDLNENRRIYKIGKTERHYSKRLREHGNEAKLILIIDVPDCNTAETIILAVLNSDPRITNCRNIGNEYFYCDNKLYFINKVLNCIVN